MRKTLIIGLAITAVVAGGAAYAAIPAPDGTIHGCYSNLTGTVKVIDSSACCGPLQTSLNWRQGDGLSRVTENWSLNFTTPVPPATAALEGSGYYDPTTSYIDSNNYIQGNIIISQDACPSGTFPVEKLVNPMYTNGSLNINITNGGEYWIGNTPTGFNTTKVNAEIYSTPQTLIVSYYIECG